MVLYILRHTKKISEKYFVGKYLKNVVNSRPALHPLSYPLSYRGSSEESKLNIYIFFLFYIFIIIIIIILLLSSPLAGKQDIVLKF